MRFRGLISTLGAGGLPRGGDRQDAHSSPASSRAIPMGRGHCWRPQAVLLLCGQPPPQLPFPFLLSDGARSRPGLVRWVCLSAWAPLGEVGMMFRLCPARNLPRVPGAGRLGHETPQQCPSEHACPSRTRGCCHSDPHRADSDCRFHCYHNSALGICLSPGCVHCLHFATTCKLAGLWASLRKPQLCTEVLGSSLGQHLFGLNTHSPTDQKEKWPLNWDRAQGTRGCLTSPHPRGKTKNMAFAFLVPGSQPCLPLSHQPLQKGTSLPKPDLCSGLHKFPHATLKVLFVCF